MTAANTGPFRVEYEGADGVFVADVSVRDDDLALHHRLATILIRMLANGALTCARDNRVPDDDLLTIGLGGRFAFKIGTCGVAGEGIVETASRLEALLNRLASA